MRTLEATSRGWGAEPRVSPAPPALACPAPPPPRAMAQPLSRPLVLFRSKPWTPAPPSPRFPNWSQPRPGARRMPRSRFHPSPPLQSQSHSQAWPPSGPLPLYHLLSQIPDQPLSQPHSQCLLKPRAQPPPLLQSPSDCLSWLSPQCPAQPNPLIQPLPSSLCFPKSLPLSTPLSHTLPLSQPRLRSGLQLPPALLLLLLFSVLGPGAGECRSRKRQGWVSGREGWPGGIQDS